MRLGEMPLYRDLGEYHPRSEMQGGHEECVLE